jgi:hypothetical protein
MQMFFLKNMVSVSIAALLFSATISLGTMADQKAAPTAPEEAVKSSLASNAEKSTEVESLSMLEDMNSSVMPANDEATMEVPSVEDGSDSSLYREMIEGELNPIETPEETPESRVQERFNLLNEEANDQNLSTQIEAVPPIPEQEPALPMPEAETATPEAQTVTKAPEDEAMLDSDFVQVVPQESILEPDVSEDLLNQDAPMQVPTDDAETPTATQMQYKIIKPEVIMAPKPTDQKGDLPGKKQEEQYGPGAKGQRKGGHQKGQQGVVEQPSDPKVIPIIRMGESLQESSGFTIIKPWNS